MQPITSLPWTPVRAPRVIPRNHRPVSLGAISKLSALENRERSLKQKNRMRIVVGFAIIAVMSGIVVPGLLILLTRVQLHSQTAAHPNSVNLRAIALPIDLAMFVITFFIAALTARNSRSAQINQFLETGTRPAGSNDNPLVRLIIMLAMLGFLFGAYLITHGIASLWLRFRLRDVDRHRVAIILQMLSNDPKGIDPRRLLQFGENPLHLRHTLGYLMAYEWADISPKGDWLTSLSPASRELRQAAAGLFQVADET